MTDDNLVEGCGGTEKKPVGDRVEPGRLYDADGRLLQLIEEGEVILESRVCDRVRLRGGRRGGSLTADFLMGDGTRILVAWERKESDER